MQYRNIEEYIEQIKVSTSKNTAIKKEIWDKEVEIIIPSGCKVKQISKEQLFIIKLIFYLDYISITNLKTILSPIMNESKVELVVGELTEAKLLKHMKKGYYGTFYYLSKYCLKLLTGEKAEGEYPLNHISNCTLEVQDYRHLYLSEMVVEKVLSRLLEVFEDYSPKKQQGYITSQFIKNISFEMMLLKPDREEYLRSLGYSDKEINRVNNLKTYSSNEREKYYKAVAANMGEVLGSGDFYSAYEKLFYEKKRPVFERYNLFYGLIAWDLDYDYFSLIVQTVRGLNRNGQITHNIIKHQTLELRNTINAATEFIVKNSRREPIESNTLVIDRKISEFQAQIQLCNAICINLKKAQNGYTKKGILTESDVPVQNEIIKYLSAYTDKKNEIQRLYNQYKIRAAFNDSKAQINAEDRPIIYLKGLELRNVFIKNVSVKKSESKGLEIYIEVVNIDRNRELKNFKSSNLRRDYFGVCEMLKNIGNDLDIPVKVNYTYCYVEGSNIIGYEDKFKKIFDNNGTSNSNMIGADKFKVYELKKYIPYYEYMEKLNSMIIYKKPVMNVDENT